MKSKINWFLCLMFIASICNAQCCSSSGGGSKFNGGIITLPLIINSNPGIGTSTLPAVNISTSICIGPGCVLAYPELLRVWGPQMFVGNGGSTVYNLSDYQTENSNNTVAMFENFPNSYVGIFSGHNNQSELDLGDSTGPGFFLNYNANLGRITISNMGGENMNFHTGGTYNFDAPVTFAAAVNLDPKTLVQILASTPTVAFGTTFGCSTCATESVCIGTGTVTSSQWAGFSGTTHPCK